MTDHPEKIGAMALEILKKDPNKAEAMEFRIAAMKAAAAVLDQELARQTMMAAMSQALKR